jgi:cytochrome bd-type quinol oxidase subunit 2
VINQWLLYAHILSVLVFLASHGVSIAVLYRVRSERDRSKIHDLVSLSGETTVPMYAALGAIVLTGVVAGIKFKSFRQWWIWLAIVLLVSTVALMVVVAKPYFARVKAACGVRPSGVPRVSDEELGEILTSSRAHVITAIGAGGLLAILYLMVFKPGV